MTDILQKQRMSWMNDLLVERRGKIAGLFLRLRDIGVRAGTSLILHLKFMHLMEQIAVDREKELDLINEIEAMEKRHDALRRKGRLRRAEDRERPVAACLSEKEEKPEERPSLWGLLGLLAFVSATPIKHKNQSLTVD